MDFPIRPYKGVGPIDFGMTPDEVRRALKAKVRSFLKTPKSVMPTDAFEKLGIYVYYKRPGHYEAVEFAGPASPTLEGKQLLGRPYTQVLNDLKELDSNLKFDDAGFRSEKFGVGIYAPYANDEPDEPVEGVIVFERGYYD